MSNNIRVKLLHPNAKLPTKSHTLDAGFDLYALEKSIIYPINDTGGHEVSKVRTGIALEIPIGYFGKIEDRSSFVSKHGVTTVAGIIDCTYRGEVLICFVNLSGRIVEIEAGERMAQLLILPVPSFNMVETDSPLSPSPRGDGGFGSTGRF